MESGDRMMKVLDHIDEFLVTLRDKEGIYKVKSPQDLLDGVTIDSIEYNFKEMNFFNNKLSILLPKEFHQMDERRAKEKYSSEQRPSVIWTNADNTIDFTLNLTNQALRTSQLALLRATLQDAICKVSPATMIFEDGRIETENQVIEFFDFKSFALDGLVYNVMFITPVAGKGLIGTFNCPFVRFDDWKPVVLQVMYSVKESLNGR